MQSTTESTKSFVLSTTSLVVSLTVSTTSLVVSLTVSLTFFMNPNVARPRETDFIFVDSSDRRGRSLVDVVVAPAAVCWSRQRSTTIVHKNDEFIPVLVLVC